MGAERRVAAATARPERLAGLTRLRVILIGWVVLYHLELALGALRGIPVAEQAVMKGYLGVDGFFLLSGFALFIGYRHRPPLGPRGWAGFVARRAERIFPLHLAALLVLLAAVLAAVAAGLHVNEPQRFGAWEFAMQALLLNAWETTEVHAWNYPSWALSAVWAGYLVFPLVLVPAKGVRLATCWAVLLAALGLLFLLAELYPEVQLNHTLHLGLVRFGLEFAMGIVLARLVTARALDGGAALAAALLLIPAGLLTGLDAVVVAGLAAAVARLGMQPPAPEEPRDLLWRLGEASFGVYLCWIFVEAALVVLLRVWHPGQGGRVALMAAGLAATLALGWLAWRWVELPAARLLARLREGATALPARFLPPRA
jgi:peptidoglycan/LPS O-acetylase OafA/YrhL